MLTAAMKGLKWPSWRILIRSVPALLALRPGEGRGEERPTVSTRPASGAAYRLLGYWLSDHFGLLPPPAEHKSPMMLRQNQLPRRSLSDINPFGDVIQIRIILRALPAK